MISLNCDYYRDAFIILSKTISIRHLGTISDPYTPLDHQIHLLIISLHQIIDCVSVYGHLVYDITKLHYYRDALIIMSKTVSIRHLGTISDTYTHSVNQIYLLNISLHLTIDCVILYQHLVYDITKYRLLQGCGDYTVKNDLDSSSRDHF